MATLAQSLVLVPAYGRDYKSKKEVMAAWLAGKDFRVEPQGCYINLSDAQVGMQLEIHYKKLQSLTLFRVTAAMKGGA